MKQLLLFLQSQQLLVIASHNEKDIWVANVYFGANEKGTIYFISPDDNTHSRMIRNNPQVAFSVAWFDPNNHTNRKAIQGLGTCRPAQHEEEIAAGVRLHNQHFPEFKERITVDWIHNNEWGSRVWVLTPTYMKYWDDQYYGEAESQEFHLS